jgi:glycosyltransferase involved in cell wall biosynthesis
VLTSVVIATYNRAASLETTLEALRHQTFADFEVVVVAGPCTDETPALLDRLARDVRVVRTEERNICVSRNLGIDTAAGDVVAFVDDDAVPEPYWLEGLVAAYADPHVGGAGGIVYDDTGVRLQYRFSLCDRLGRGIYDCVPQDAHNRARADPFVYLQGTNMSFRRSALEEVRGFDEHIEYVWDEADLALRMLDSGWLLRPIDGAAVHHKVLASASRRAAGLVTDPHAMVKNRVYFALRNGLASHRAEEVFQCLTDYTRDLRTVADNAWRREALTTAERESFSERVEAGFQAGFELGLGTDRAVRVLAPHNAEAFHEFPVRRSGVRRTGVCVLASEPPSAPIAVPADDVHLVARADGPYRIDFEHGAWVHRLPAGPRQLPALADHPLRERLGDAVAFWWAAHNAAARTPLQVVTGNADDTLVCTLDPRWRTVVAGSGQSGQPVERALSGAAETPPIDAAAAKLAVSDGLRQLLERAGVIDDPDAAVAQLLEPSAFPFDYLAALAPLMHASDRDFVIGVYRILLRRAPEPEWLEAALYRLREGLKARSDIVHDVATSEEAALLGVDDSFTDRMPRELPPLLERRIRDAFWRDDRQFARLITVALLASEAQDDVDAVSAQLAAGRSRRQVLRDLVERADVRARIPVAAELLTRTFMTSMELRDRLVELSDVDDARFVQGAYRLLLEREPDAASAIWHEELARTSRRWVIIGIAFSREAQQRGIDPTVVNAIAETIPALNSPPLPRGAEGKVLRTVRAVQDLGKRRAPSRAEP